MTTLFFPTPLNCNCLLICFLDWILSFENSYEKACVFMLPAQHRAEKTITKCLISEQMNRCYPKILTFYSHFTEQFAFCQVQNWKLVNSSRCIRMDNDTRERASGLQNAVNVCFCPRKEQSLAHQWAATGGVAARKCARSWKYMGRFTALK